MITSLLAPITLALAPVANLKVFDPVPPLKLSIPAPPVITSLPPPPMMMSLPAPPTIVSAASVPVTFTVIPDAAAFTFKLAAFKPAPDTSTLAPKAVEALEPSSML